MIKRISDYVKFKIYIESEKYFQYFTIKELIEGNLLKKYETNNSNIFMETGALKELIEGNLLKKYETNNSNIFMETGALDCLGDEIFEGDICIVGYEGHDLWEECQKERYENVGLAIVEYNKDSFEWSIRFVDNKWRVRMVQDIDWYNPLEYKVVGNIAEFDLSKINEQQWIKNWYESL